MTWLFIYLFEDFYSSIPFLQEQRGIWHLKGTFPSGLYKKLLKGDGKWKPVASLTCIMCLCLEHAFFHKGLIPFAWVKSQCSWWRCLYLWVSGLLESDQQSMARLEQILLCKRSLKRQQQSMVFSYSNPYIVSLICIAHSHARLCSFTVNLHVGIGRTE